MTVIQQALFGYSNGHHLLSSSIEFDSTELKILEPLSDFSGNILPEDFDGYIMGYNLRSKNCYVLSKTWYAKEMQRPGCVWTQILLFPYDLEEAQLRNIDFEKCFERPNINDTNWKEKYTKPIVFKNEHSFLVNDSDNTEDIFSYNLLSLLLKDSTPIVITEKQCEIYNIAFYNLIKTFGFGFFDDISFCTGSFVNRKYNGNYFSIQIVPQNLSKSNWRVKEKNRIINREEVFNSLLLNDFNYEKSNIYHAKEFILSLDDVKLTRKTLNFGLSYTKNFISNVDFTIKSIMNSAKQCFDDLKTIQNIAEKTFYSLFFNKEIDKNKFLDFCSTDIDIKDWEAKIIEQDLPQFINHLLNRDDLIIYRVCEDLLKVEVNRLGEETLKSIALSFIPDNLDYFINNSYGTIDTFISLNWKLALNEKVWKQTYDVQCDVLKTIKTKVDGSCNEDLIVSKNLLFTIFNTSEESIVDRIYYTFGKDSIRVFFEWANGTSDMKKIKNWVPICKYDFVSTISEVTNIHSTEVFSMVINTIDPYDKDAQMISVKTWNQLFVEYCKETSNHKCDKLFAQFILPIILQSEKIFPEEIISYAFTTVHKLLAEDKMEYNKWEKLALLLPEVAWHKRWDKCKRLRKAAKLMNYKMEFKY